MEEGYKFVDYRGIVVNVYGPYANRLDSCSNTILECVGTRQVMSGDFFKCDQSHHGERRAITIAGPKRE